ncbi:MAG: hypothetical protein Q7S37_01275 [bacterium]|nr:hypothetical protein [bacterium]
MGAKRELLEKLEWDPLFVSSREALKMIREDFISRGDISKELLELSKKIQEDKNIVLPSVERYKINLINEAHIAISEGIFSISDIENLKAYYSKRDITIFGTPRVLNGETEMAWAIIFPLIERLEKWKKLSELSQSGVVTTEEAARAKASIVEGRSLEDSLGKSVLFLDRLRYAKHKGIVDEVGYTKAIQLIPLMKQEILGETTGINNLNSQEVLAGIERGDKSAIEQEIVAEEDTQINGFVQQSDPIFEWRRLIYILIAAWQATLDVELKGEFDYLLSSSDLELLQDAHKFLVHLNKEYVADDRIPELKNSLYVKKINDFVLSNKVKVRVG